MESLLHVLLGSDIAAKAEQEAEEKAEAPSVEVAAEEEAEYGNSSVWRDPGNTRVLMR